MACLFFSQYEMVGDADIEDNADDEWAAKDNMDKDMVDNDHVNVVDMNVLCSTISAQLSTNSIP